MLARLANEFFTALPGTSQPRAAAAPVADTSYFTPPAQVPATPLSASPEFSLPSDPHFSSAPAGVGPAVVAPVTAPVQAGAPAVPGSLAGSAAAQGAQIPTFSFLEEARPIFVGAGQKPAAAYPEARPITEFVQLSSSQLQASPQLDGDAFA